MNVCGPLCRSFGPGATNPDLWVDPDSYELPLVAACCGPFDYANATSAEKQPYIRNCLADTAQQVCHALPYLLGKAAEETNDVAEEIALKWAAGEVKKREDECLQALWNGGPTMTDPTRLIGNSWSPFNDVTFELVDAEVWDWTVDGEVNWRTCESFYENDPAVVPTAPFQVPGTVAMGQASLLSGTSMSGSGPGNSVATIVPSTSGSSLTVAYMADGSLQVTGLLLEASAATVEVFGVEGQLERSSVTLTEPLVPRSAGGEHTVGIGDGKFVATATFEGGSRTIDFTNADPIVFRQTTAGQWEFDSFDLTYTESGFGTWTLSFDGLLFQPPT